MLKLKANPTFKAKVEIPAPGGEKVPVTFEFRHMTKTALEQFISGEDAKGRSDEDTILAVAVDWIGVDAEFSRNSLTELFEQFHAAPRSIIQAYLLELTQARLGN